MEALGTHCFRMEGPTGGFGWEAVGDSFRQGSEWELPRFDSETLHSVGMAKQRLMLGRMSSVLGIKIEAVARSWFRGACF